MEGTRRLWGRDDALSFDSFSPSDSALQCASSSCSACWNKFPLPSNYQGKSPKCPQCRATIKRLPIGKRDELPKEEEEKQYPLIIELIHRVAQACQLSKGDPWLNTLLLLSASLHLSSSSGAKLEEWKNEEQKKLEFEGPADFILNNFSDLGSSGSNDSGELDIDSDEGEAETQTLPKFNVRVDEDVLLGLGALMHEIYPEIGLKRINISEGESTSHNVLTDSSHSLYKSHQQYLNLKRASLLSLEELVQFMETIKLEISIALDYYTYFCLLASIIRKIKLEQQNSAAVEESEQLHQGLRRELQDADCTNWITSLLLYFSSNANGTVNAKEVKITRQKREGCAPICERVEKKLSANTADTAKVLDNLLLNEQVLSETKQFVPPPSIKQQVEERVAYVEIREMCMYQAPYQSHIPNLVREARGISQEELNRRQQNLQDVGRAIEFEVMQNEANTKNVPLTCVPQSIECEMVYDLDFSALSVSKARQHEQQPLNVPEESVRLLNSVAGSWKLKLELIINQAHKRGVQDLHDKITHQNFLEDMEKTMKMKMKMKKSPTAKIKWQVACPICFETFEKLDEGLLCTGEVPHWCCVNCLSCFCRLKFDELCPDIRCVTSTCQARYINTHLIQKISGYVTDADAMYTQATMMVYKMEFPYPQHVQCEICQYLTEPIPGQKKWTCGQGVGSSLLTGSDRPCGAQWCLQCAPMRKVHSGPHKISDFKERNQIDSAIANGSVLTCPTCANGASILKSYGSNHMKCLRCHSHYCYVCGVNIKNPFKLEWQSSQHGCPLFGNDEQVCKQKARNNVAKLAQDNNWSDQQLLDFARDALKDIDWPTA